MIRRSFQVLMAMLACAIGLTTAGASQNPGVPTSLSGPVPFGGDGFGEARFRLSTRPDGSAVADLIDSLPHSFATASLLREIGRLQVNGVPVPAIIGVKFVPRPNSDCLDRDTNREIEVRWPTITISGRHVVCTSTSGLAVQEYATSGPVQGLVVDESGKVLPGVDVLIMSRGTLAINRQLKTDSAGRFLVNNLPNGDYIARFDSDGLHGKEFDLVVTDTLKPDTWRITLPKVVWRTPAPPAIVTAADIPQYPTEAWAAGVSGTVDVRVSFAEEPRRRNVHYVADIDVAGADERLIRAVRQNVATWRFTNVSVPVLTIRFTFGLIAGDCSSPQFPALSLKFPSLVEIVAKRRVQCLPFQAPVGRGPRAS